MTTSLNGTSSRKYSELMTMRATHSAMMSRCGDERRRGMMALEQLRLLRPALRGEGPQLRAEPGVQHVLVLMHVMTAALGAHIGVPR